jgi:hypothetical protein
MGGGAAAEREDGVEPRAENAESGEGLVGVIALNVGRVVAGTIGGRVEIGGVAIVFVVFSACPCHAAAEPELAALP